MIPDFVPVPCVGSWLSLGSPAVTELAVDSGFHWLLMDLEHGMATEATIPDQLRAFRGSSAVPIVRVPAAVPDQIARLLDWGAAGIMVPHVNSAAEATACVQAMRYPPRGQRGVSRSVRTYGYGRLPFPENTPAHDAIFIAQIETVEAVMNAAAIAAVDGVDVLFIGPADLQYDLQARASSTQVDYHECLQRVQQAALNAGKQCGLLVRDIADLEMLLNRGFTWLAIDSDMGLLRSGYQRTLTLWNEKTGGSR